MRPPLALLLAALAGTACDPPEPPRPAADASLDALADVVPEASMPDATPDAPADVPLGAYTCRPCLYDAECGEGGRCVPVDAMNLPGSGTCLVACAKRGAACDAPVPSTCREDDATGALLCTPAASCIPMASRRAVACPEAGCAGRYSVCADLARTDGVNGRTGTACLPPCERDSDCEDGLRRCRAVRTRDGEAARACVPDERFGPEACGLRAVDARGVGRGCDAMTPCPAGLECLAGLDPALPRGFCTAACARDADCGGGARCLAAGDRGPRCVPDDCACGAGARDALLDRALAQGDPAWSRCNLYFTLQNLDAFPPNVSRDRFRLPVFDRVHRDWLRGARWARDTGPGLDARAATLSGALAAVAGLREDGSTASVAVPAPVAPPADARAAALDALAGFHALGGGDFDRAAADAALARLPAPLTAALARVLMASLDAARARDRGLPFARDPDSRERLFTVGPYAFLPTNRAGDRPDFTGALELGSLQGDVALPVPEALRLAATVEAVDWAPLRGMEGPSLDLDTPLGRVVVRDGAAHRYGAAEFARTLLAVDLGGADTYENPAASNADADNPVSVLVDLGGDDAYRYPEVPSALDREGVMPSDEGGRARSGAVATPSMSRTGRQGSARLGVALLYDLGGNDRYRSLRMSQGFASYGVGGLYDAAGDDEYAAEAASQGAAVAGVAALVDAAGDDRYTAWAFAQGYAYVQGAAALYDRDGRDAYESKVTPVLYGSAQDMTVNSSFAQGAGFGRRGDAFPDRTNMSGGLGVLRDRAGDDTYVTAIFGQGTGYWGGMGLLLDGAGDDRYDGRWYVQGGAAHFAYAALVDGGGRDVHNMTATRQNMTAGAGHDFSLGVLLALGREGDEYRAPNLAVGAGNANGAGLFADEGGDDRYALPTRLSLGNAALETLTDMGRLARPTAGVFLDGDGSDAYERATPADEGNDRRWTQRIHPEAPSERGFGADGSGAVLGL